MALQANGEKEVPLHDEHIEHADSETYKKDVEGKDVINEEHDRVWKSSNVIGCSA
jgi:hypothetical protein